MSEETFGWWFPHRSRKAHYLPKGQPLPRSLCRKWGFIGTPAPGIFEADNGPSPDDCAICRRKLDLLGTKEGGE